MELLDRDTGFTIVIGLQEIIVWVVVLASVLYLVLRFYRTFSAKDGCNTQCGCAKQELKPGKQS